MASSSAIKKLVQNSAILKRGAEAARQEIFGHLPQLNIQSGHRKAKVSFTGPYLARYYPESINTFARKVREIWAYCFRCPPVCVACLTYSDALWQLVGTRWVGDGPRRIPTNQVGAKTTKGKRCTKKGVWITFQEEIRFAVDYGFQSDRKYCSLQFNIVTRLLLDIQFIGLLYNISIGLI